ncbi:MAG: dihydrolipoyl dehydrogenase [Clostridiales bacterium]|nr:dihydrolipoyl dehydrogenase [Clostridiales bacterium]
MSNNYDKLVTDLLIIGGGPGGYMAAIYGAKHGLSVTLVEKDTLGGTCLNVGCIPTKALVKSAEVCHTIRNSEEFGVIYDGKVHVDMEKIISRKDEVKDRLVAGVEFLMKKNKIQVLRGEASFISNKSVVVKGDTSYSIEFTDVIIATGSRISKINIPGIDLPMVMNSTKALSLTELPSSITIVGGGVIGMEFAFIYRNLGVEVNVIEYMDRLLTMVDKDVSREIKKTCKKAGIIVVNNAKVLRIDSNDKGSANVVYEDKKGEQIIESEKVLIAIGREPNMENLAIDNTEVLLNENGRGIAVNGQMKTNVDHIYAIGDVTNIIQLAHVASHQGIVAVDNILGNHKLIDYKAAPNVIFTSPEIASVGLTEEQCVDNALDFSVSKVSYMSNGKALTMKQTEGFIKLIKDNNNNKILGCSIIGADASSLISTITLSVSKGVTDEELRNTIFPHPTTSEVIHEAVFGLGIGSLSL